MTRAQTYNKRDISSVTLLEPVNLQPGVVTYCKAFNNARGEITNFHLQFADSVTLGARVEGSSHPNATASGSSQDPTTFDSQGGHGEPETWFEYDFDDATPSISGTTGVIAAGCIHYDLSGVGATWMRLKLMPTTSGTVSVYGSLKAHIY